MLRGWGELKTSDYEVSLDGEKYGRLGIIEGRAWWIQ